MALQGIIPVQQRQQQKVQRGGKLGQALGGLGAVAGGIIGTFTSTGPLAGASMGASAGGALGGLIDPVRTKTVTQEPQMMGQIGGGQSLAQKYKMSNAGRMALEGLQVAKAVPEYSEYQEPLAMAILQDIATNNRQRMG